MRQVIAGRLYDTEADGVEEVGNYSFSNRNDFRHVDESLYKTKSGRYFVAGEGGPLTHYAQSVGNNSTAGGSGIRVFTETEALTWCESHDIDADSIAKHFDVEPA